jgi:hypothetical protein
MSIAKTLTLSLAATLILATHMAPSFAAVDASSPTIQIGCVSDPGQTALDDIWDYILGWL